MKEIIKLENVSYSYETSSCALKDINFSIYKGDKVALIGNNGAGKSTLMLCCAGAIFPTDGNITIEQELITSKNISILRKNVGLVFQDADSQIIAPTVESEISFGPINLNFSDEMVAKAVDNALDDMNLQDFRTRVPHQLSGGEKKRVTIADILAMEPKIVMMDEPTASLDINHVKILEQKLEDMSDKNISLVISTHDVDFVYRWANRVIVMNNAQIIADDTVQNVFTNDELLASAGLEKPLILQIAQLLDVHINNVYPKSINEFKQMTEKKYAR